MSTEGNKLSDPEIEEITSVEDDDIIPILRGLGTLPVSKKARKKYLLANNVPGLLNVKQFPYGAVGNAKIVNDAAVSGATLTSASAAFTSSITGMKFDLAGAGAAAELCAIITAYTDSTHVEVSIPASYSASGQTISLDNVTIATGSMTVGDNTLVAGSAFFNASDVGKLVRCTGVGAKNIVGTLTYVNATTATMSVSASVAVSDRRLIFGTDDKAAIQAAIDALPNGGEIFFPRGNYLIGSVLTVDVPGITFTGSGMFTSVLYSVGPKMLDSGSVYNLLTINTPASDVHFESIGFSGTNWTAQDTLFGVATADGVVVSSTGPIENISANRCRFDSFWGIGFHVNGSAGLTLTSSTTVKDITVTNCHAAFNSYDGLNPNALSGVTVEDCILTYNGSAGCEASTANSTFNNNRCYLNRLAGLSIGGYGDSAPFTSESTTIQGNTCNLNGQYGIALASNQCSTIVSGNTCRMNGLFGIGAIDAGGTLATTNKISMNICDSNGRTGSGSSGIYATIDNMTIEMNICTDRGITGYDQQFGMLSYGDNLTYTRNYSLGNTSHDYSFQSGSAWLDNIYPTAVIFNGGATLYYPANVAALYTHTFSATPVFDARLGSAQKIVLTANVTSSTFTNAVAGQVFTFIIVQDGTGSRTFVWPTNVKWAGGTAPTLSTGINKVDEFTGRFDGTNLLIFAQALDVR